MTSSPQLVSLLRQWMDSTMHRSMHEWRGYVKSTGLTMPQFGILMKLHHQGNCDVSNISEHMDISLAAASQLVEKLVKHDFIERTQNETDRRVRHISLSAKGRNLIKKGMEQRYHLLDEIAATLNADESAKVAEALIILTEKVKQVDTETGKHGSK